MTEQVSAELSKLGINCATYHAGMGIKPRRETHHKFMRDEIQVRDHIRHKVIDCAVMFYLALLYVWDLLKHDLLGTKCAI